MSEPLPSRRDEELTDIKQRLQKADPKDPSMEELRKSLAELEDKKKETEKKVKEVEKEEKVRI